MDRALMARVQVPLNLLAYPTLFLTVRCRFDPVFVLPIAEPVQLDSDTSNTTVKKLGRRTGTGSAAISNSASFASKTRPPTPRAKVLGFKVVSLWSILAHTGRVPIQTSNGKEGSESLEEVRKRARGPVVVFPECTTSNGRGLLRFADIFKHERDIPASGRKIFLMCIRWGTAHIHRPASKRLIASSLDTICPRASSHPSATQSPRTC